MNRNTAKISGGFTLIELLVVIAIIALLLAILGPSLGKATDKVEEVICRSNLKQWALVFTLYANDNDDSFPLSETDGIVTPEDAWQLGALLPYYEDLDLRDCPSTKPGPRRAPQQYNYGGTFIEWGPFPASDNKRSWWDHYAEGSYGFNTWIADPPPGMVLFWEHPSAKAIRTTYEPGAYMIPMVFDSVWVEQFVKMNNDAPTNLQHELDVYDDDADWARNSLKFVCIDRHSGGVNLAFVDGDVRHVGVKGLWLLKWHKDWIKCEPGNAWPTWTDRYPDYEF